MNRHAAIHWKTNNAQHVVVVDGNIRDWPDSLGPRPTEEQITAWMAEYDIWKTEQDALKADEDAVEVLIQKKMRDNAIADLKKEGKLDANGKIKK
jgi:hypothetical protein